MSDNLDFIKLDVQGRIALLAGKLLEADPMLPVHLAAIHGAIIQYEELVHLLSDEEIQQLVAGQEKHTGTKLMEEVTRAPKARVNARIPKTSVDDL